MGVQAYVVVSIKNELFKSVIKMKKVNDRIPVLIMKYLKGLLMKEERAELEEWLNKSELNQALFDELTDEQRVKLKLQRFQTIKKDDVWDKTIRMINQEEGSRETMAVRRFVPWYRTAAVASVLILISIGSYFYLKNNQEEPSHQTVENQIIPDLEPGSDKAFLTLADGTVVSLDSIEGEISLMSGMTVRKTNEGKLVYEIASSTRRSGEGLKYNQVSTPRGGQYQIVLADGTKVWLNSASSLKYPIQFDGTSRIVELTGEAYFEVNAQKGVANQSIPFLVKTSKQTIEVLGTHFNVSSYEDEGSVKTTLLEGKVAVSVNSYNLEDSGFIGDRSYNDRIVLKPNEQSILSKNSFKVIEVNGDDFVAWKNGYFSFQRADLRSVMHQLSRWYDVDIVYTGEIPKETFTGKIYRNMSLSKVLEVLAFAGVNFKIEGVDNSILVIY